MSYFRDSGTYDKLKETFNRLRLLPGNYPLKKTIKHQHPLGIKSLFLTPVFMKTFPNFNFGVISATEARLCCDLEDEEQVEVDIDYNDDDPIDEITIRQVYSTLVFYQSLSVSILLYLSALYSYIKFCTGVPSPAKIASTEALLKNCSSTVTITPVYPDEKNKNQYMFAQPNGMIIDKITPSEVFPVDHPIPNMMIPSVSSSPNHEGMQKENTFGHPLVPLDLTPSAVTGFPPPPPPVFVASPKPAPALKENWRKSYHRMGNVLKKKTDKAEKRNAVVNSVDISGTSASSPPEYGANLPLNLKKKLKRPSECSVKCNICGKSYSSKGVMSRHIKEAHQADPQFPCFYCPNKFRNGPARLEHMNTSHPEDMNSSLCPYCMRKSSSVAGKRNHMMYEKYYCNS